MSSDNPLSKVKLLMNLAELYQWLKQLKGIFGFLGYWQVFGLALYSYGVVVAQQCAPSRVAEALPLLGQAATVQRRLERWLANGRIDWLACCVAWSGYVLRHYVGQLPILLVDETKLGKHLSVMMIGLAYRGCCIPLLWWAYRPDKWPMGQVHLIEHLLCSLAQVVPDAVKPLIEADRGIGTSPDLVRAIQALGWYYLLRVQGQTCFLLPDGSYRALKQMVERGGDWTAPGQVFKGAGWLDSIGHVIWDEPYEQAWCLITNCPFIKGREYAKRYWQEASFRDLKSDGWQWQASHIFTPAYANLLLLVLAVAYAWVLSLGTLAFEEGPQHPLMTGVFDADYSLFRTGLRLWKHVLGHVHPLLMSVAQAYFVFFEPPPLACLKSVGV